MDAIDLMRIVYKKDNKIPKKFSLLSLMGIGVRLETENKKIGFNEGIETAAHYIKDEKLKQQILNLKNEAVKF